jgi:hypothetical protein
VGATVFANGMSIACKAASGKSAAAFPDVCLSPPSPPAGPIPIPYPNTAMASDTDKGSKTVQIGGQEVMLKDKSVFKTSMGNEAATKSFGMGVVTHQIQGEASFIAWSMDVKFEGENVPRHLDLMGHNEACAPTDTPPMVFVDTMTPPAGPTKPCKTTCAKEPSEERMDKIRAGTPTPELREIAQLFEIGVCGHSGGGHPMEADHCVSLDEIMRTPGFACLPDETQMEIANNPNNFDPLCKSCNSSKQEKDWFNWKGNKTSRWMVPPSVSKPMQEKTAKVREQTRGMVENGACKV